MLRKPSPTDWLTWRRTLDSWGYSPLNEINRNNVSQLKMMWTRGIGSGRTQEATPLVYNGVMYVPNPGDIIRRSTPRPAICIWEYQREVSRRRQRRHQPQHGDLGQHDHRRQRRQQHVRARRADRQAGVGNAGARVRRARQRQLGPDHRQRQGDHRPPVPARRRPTTRASITAHDAKTGKELWRTRTIPRPGEPGDETWGDVPMEQRWHVGTWMVPSYDPELNLIYRRHVGDDPGAEVHARRQRQAAPLSQLHAGAQRRHRQDRLVLPAHRRSLGSRSSVRAAARRHRRRARSRSEVRVDQPEDQAGRAAQGRSPAFPARPASSTRSIARPASSSGRGRR